MTSCLRGPVRCAERSVVEGGGVVAGNLADGRPFCATDHRAVVTALTDLPWLRLELAVARGQPAPAGDGGTRRVHPDIPIREDVDALERELDLAVFSWAEALGDHLHLAPLRRFYAASQRLVNHLDNYYCLPTTAMSRWIDDRAVASLPAGTVGTVRASGEAIVIREMTGAHGAMELLRLHGRGCSLLRRDVHVPGTRP